MCIRDRHIIVERMFQIQMIDWIDQTLCLPFCQQISSRHHQKKDPNDVWKKLPNCRKHIINSLGGTKNRPILQSDRIIKRLLSKCCLLYTSNYNPFLSKIKKVLSAMVLCFHKTAPILTALSFYDTVLSLTIFHIIYAQCTSFSTHATMP